MFRFNVDYEDGTNGEYEADGYMIAPQTNYLPTGGTQVGTTGWVHFYEMILQEDPYGGPAYRQQVNTTSIKLENINQINKVANTGKVPPPAPPVQPYVDQDYEDEF
jgi:hypothetical protein